MWTLRSHLPLRFRRKGLESEAVTGGSVLAPGAGRLITGVGRASSSFLKDNRDVFFGMIGPRMASGRAQAKMMALDGPGQLRQGPPDSLGRRRSSSR